MYKINSKKMSRGDFGVSARSEYGATSVSYHRTSSSRDQDNFNRLCDNVSGKIFQINKNVSKLENISKQSQILTSENESKIHILNQETNKHANETKGLFKEISEYTRVGRYEQNDHRQQQYNLQQEKLCREFETSLSRYHAIQNTLSMKMKEVIEKEVNVSKDTSALIDISYDEQPQDEQEDPERQRTEQLLSHQQELEYVRERQERIQQIESDMLNVNEIFRDLALIVHEQGATVDSIESNIENAAVHVEEANKQLVRAKNYQKSARKRLCCIALVSIIAATILVLIIYYSVK